MFDTLTASSKQHRVRFVSNFISTSHAEYKGSPFQTNNIETFTPVRVCVCVCVFVCVETSALISIKSDSRETNTTVTGSESFSTFTTP